MLSALFSKLFGKRNQSPVRAPHSPALPLVVEDGMVVAHFPVPPEEILLDMAYHQQAKDGTVRLVLDLECDSELIDAMLQSAHAGKSQPVETAGKSATSK